MPSRKYLWQGHMSLHLFAFSFQEKWRHVNHLGNSHFAVNMHLCNMVLASSEVQYTYNTNKLLHEPHLDWGAEICDQFATIGCFWYQRNKAIDDKKTWDTILHDTTVKWHWVLQSSYSRNCGDCPQLQKKFSHFFKTLPSREAKNF